MNEDELKRIIRETVKESLREQAPRPSGHTDGHAEGVPHFVGKWQHYCTHAGCEQENPDWKDETKCKDCGMHLGSVETAKSLARCPNCGGHSAKKL